MKNDNTLSFAGLVGLMLASTLTIMVGSAIVPALPKIAVHYGLGNLVGWLVTVPSMGVVIFALFSGKLIDKIGAYPMIIMGLFATAIFGAFGFKMPNIPLLLLDRFLLGASTATVMASSTSLISQFYTGEKQIKMIAIQGMVIQLGGVLFLTLSGALAEINWYSSFYIYLISLIPFILIIFCVPNTMVNIKRKSEKATNVNENENTGKKPIKEILLLTFFVNLLFFTSVLNLPNYLQLGFGYSSTFTGSYLAAISIVAVISIGFIPKIVKHFSVKIDLIAGFISYTIAHFVLFKTHNTIFLIFPIIFMGIGFGLTHTLLNNIIVARSSIYNKGVNLSLFSLAMFAGQIMASIITSFFIGVSSFLVCSILAFCLTFLVLFFFERKKV